MGKGADRAYYEEVAQKAKSAQKNLQKWESGPQGEPPGDIKSLPGLVGNGFGLHKEVQDDLDIRDKTPFAEAVFFIKATNSITQRPGANLKLFNALTTIERACLTMAARKAQEEKEAVSSPVAMTRESTPFVSESRIAELRLLKPPQWDLTKLIGLLEELNKVYRGECYMATAMLVRAFMDHIPPIFGMSGFGHVAANYGGGGKSFKQAAQHLDSAMRKIADAQLHLQIRKSETLLNENSVHFQADLDNVLAEVVRVLK